jgi:hypothetical protein
MSTETPFAFQGQTVLGPNYIKIFHFSYKHAIDGLMRVAREEGFRKLFNGADWASSRAVLVTVGQLSCYDVIKSSLLETDYFEDNLATHFTSSLAAVRKKERKKETKKQRKKERTRACRHKVILFRAVLSSTYKPAARGL